MPGSFKNKLQKHEFLPPPAAWDKISRKLDEEFNASDARLSQKVDQFSVAPPPFIWEKIQQEIHKPIPADSAGRVMPLYLKRLAVAVILIAFLGAGAFYFLINNNPPQKFTVAHKKTSTQKAAPVRPDTNYKKSPAVTDEQPETTEARKPQLAVNERPIRKTATNKRRIETPLSSNYDAVTVNDIEEARSTAEPVTSLQPIDVSAPLIRDAKGNIIMDMRLISKPGQQYITVTSPNGNQTRISNKFINCLKFLHGDVSSYDDGDAVECRAKFDQWRKKLLTEAAFIPAADNFFDIFEMKEMIQD